MPAQSLGLLQTGYPLQLQRPTLVSAMTAFDSRGSGQFFWFSLHQVGRLACLSIRLLRPTDARPKPGRQERIHQGRHGEPAGPARERIDLFLPHVGHLTPRLAAKEAARHFCERPFLSDAWLSCAGTGELAPEIG